MSIRLNQRTTTSIPVYGNLSRQCPDRNSTQGSREDTCTHRDVRRPTERLRQRHYETDLERDAETFQKGSAIGAIYVVDNRLQQTQTETSSKTQGTSIFHIKIIPARAPSREVNVNSCHKQKHPP